MSPGDKGVVPWLCSRSPAGSRCPSLDTRSSGLGIGAAAFRSSVIRSRALGTQRRRRGRMQTEIIDITPSPRVLRMLGQIDFAAWQCLSELIDNSIDAFLEGQRGDKPLTLDPSVAIELPSAVSLDAGTGEIIVKDNGPGMTEDELRKAVKAGYSGNDPVEKLGLFGMGFNIATARLGKRTEVWTTTAESGEWIGVEIDFDRLEEAGEFAAPRLQRAKSDEELQQGGRGTEVRVSKLDPARVRPLIWGAGKPATRRRLGKIYSRVIDQLGVTILFGDDLVDPIRHCTWNRKRSVSTSDHGNVPAVIDIDETLSTGRFCDVCWVWLESFDETCPACGNPENVRERARRITGWIGIQRYFDKQHFGIDLIRNGRVIEELDKSLFDWVDPETNDRELEYPIDTTHWGGRIVGELEVDFVRVSHQKDSFDKLDPQWSEVMERIRGKSPFRPRIAERRGYPRNTSPLGRLFSAYRSGNRGGLEDLVPCYKDGRGRNDSLIQDWVRLFHHGDTDYQDDDKWYELVLLGEEAKRGGSSGSRGAAGTLPIMGGPQATGEGATGDDGQADAETAGTPAPETIPPVQANIFETDIELSGTYRLARLPGSPSMTVNARRALGGLGGRPIFFDTPSSGAVEFQYDQGHFFFEESLDTALDCLVSDLAHRFLLLSGQTQRDWPLATIERDIRREYFPETLTSVTNAAEEARAILDDLRAFLDENLAEVAPIPATLMDEHTLVLVRKGILETALGGEQDVQEAISSGVFIRYVDTEFLVSTPRHWPGLILDGRFVTVPYEDVSASHQSDSIAMVCDALRDAAWIVSDSGGGALSKDQRWRLRFARALSSVRLLQKLAQVAQGNAWVHQPRTTRLRSLASARTRPCSANRARRLWGRSARRRHRRSRR